MPIIRDHSYNKATPSVVGGLAVSAVIVIAVIAMYNTITQQDSFADTPAEEVISPEPDEAIQPDPVVDLAGTGMAAISNIDYSVPRNHTGYMDIQLSFEDYVIVDMQVDHTFDEVSVHHIESFEAEIKDRVVGRQLDEVDESLIGNASLTSEAFFKALRTVDTSNLEESLTQEQTQGS